MIHVFIKLKFLHLKICLMVNFFVKKVTGKEMIFTKKKIKTLGNLVKITIQTYNKSLNLT